MNSIPRLPMNLVIRSVLCAGFTLFTITLSAGEKDTRGAETTPAAKSSIAQPKPATAGLPEIEIANLVSAPVRLRFMSADVNPKDPKDITFDVVTADVRGRVVMYRSGDRLANTPFKVGTYTHKEIADGIKKDVSELTVIHEKHGWEFVLKIGEATFVPGEIEALFRHAEKAPGEKKLPDVQVKIGESFSLPAAPDTKYKVAQIKPTTLDLKGEVTAGEVTIELPSGERVKKMFPQK